MTSLVEQERKLMEELSQRVHRTFAAAAAAGVPTDAFADVQAIADAMSAALPTHHVYDQVVGPFYDTAGLTRWWKVSRQAVSKKVATNAVIACRLEEGQWVYPVWQFTRSGTVRPDLVQVWRVLRSGADPWTGAMWLRAPQDALAGKSAVQWLTDNGSVDTVLTAARADVQRWAA
ncbi:hypothetical protein OPAG_08092 [Rhodococcus opacus PD630]|uniref:hypothetical protein n=1 Tax=Rhodococcus opacus TaxID=37919 RepID=UPI00029CB220|nr:hypothetical protein [Rhodococcus opacus]EHI41270.1 hypothetical protein OPAG_08092 [Rhodococcus opacus PD630]